MCEVNHHGGPPLANGRIGLRERMCRATRIDVGVDATIRAGSHEYMHRLLRIVTQRCATSGFDRNGSKRMRRLRAHKSKNYLMEIHATSTF